MTHHQSKTAQHQIAVWIADEAVRCHILVDNPERAYGFMRAMKHMVSALDADRKLKRAVSPN